MLDGQAVKFADAALDTQGSGKSLLFCNALPLCNMVRAGGISLVKHGVIGIVYWLLGDQALRIVLV